MRTDVPESLKNIDFSHFTDAEIMDHFNNRCQVCGSAWEVALYHLVFRSQLGINGPRIPLCRHCHSRLHGEAGFRDKWELKLFKIAETFYILRTQTSLF